MTSIRFLVLIGSRAIINYSRSLIALLFIMYMVWLTTLVTWSSVRCSSKGMSSCNMSNPVMIHDKVVFRNQWVNFWCHGDVWDHVQIYRSCEFDKLDCMLWQAKKLFKSNNWYILWHYYYQIETLLPFPVVNLWSLCITNVINQHCCALYCEPRMTNYASSTKVIHGRT